MNKLQLTHILIYPVKGLPGISLSQSVVEARGLQYDRRWMLVDEHGMFISQRTVPELALFKVERMDTDFVVQSPHSDSKIKIPLIGSGMDIKVTVWDDTLLAQNYMEEVNHWFTEQIHVPCKLVYLPDTGVRLIEKEFNLGIEPLSFADAFPLLVLGESSLNDLNQKLDELVRIDRFRPNLVFEGGFPYEEDTFLEFSIHNQHFNACRPCGRCSVPTINQQTARMGKEPLKTLSSYRTKDNKVFFGENAKPIGEGGLISVGDTLNIISRKVSVFEE